MKYTLLTLAFLFVFSITLSAQEEENSSLELKPAPRALIKIAPFQFFVQTFELSVEGLNKTYKKAFQISAGYRSGQNDFINGKGATMTLAYRGYSRPLNKPLVSKPEVTQGIYYSLFLKGEYFNGDNDNATNQSTTINSISPGFTIGLQRLVFEVLYLDVYLGGGIKFTDINNESNTITDGYDLLHPGYEGIYPVAGIKVGIGL